MTKPSKRPPGEARPAGHSVADTLQADEVSPPAPLLEQRCDYLGDEPIAASRYTSEAFARREEQAVWARTWQWVCREEHIPDAGDSYVYDIGPWSIIVVRGEDGAIRALHNRCTHRGTRLIGAEGAGFSQGLACPFHGWRWHLDGQLANLPGAWDFPHASADTHSLQVVACDTWSGFVFINLDTQCQPLADYLGVMAEHFQHFPIAGRRIAVHVTKRLPANWKSAQEAFMEAYHNFETHDTPNGGNTQYDVLDTHVSRFIHNIGNYSPEALADYPGSKWRDPVMTEEETLASLSMFGVDGPLAEGQTARQKVARGLREQLSASLGRDMSDVSEALLLDSIEYHLFPSMFFFPGIGVPMVYRFRPDPHNVHESLFDLLLMEEVPAAESVGEPPEPIYLDIEQSYTEVPELAWLGAVYDQDTGNLQLQTQGLKSLGEQGITLGNYQEARIRHVHQLIDQYMETLGA